MLRSARTPAEVKPVCTLEQVQKAQAMTQEILLEQVVGDYILDLGSCHAETPKPMGSS